jgi:pimeloyl-ACP methyl ester carboxylesterase
MSTMVELHGRHLMKLADFSPEEWPQGFRPEHVKTISPRGVGMADAVERVDARGHGLAATYLDCGFTSDGIWTPAPDEVQAIADANGGTRAATLDDLRRIDVPTLIVHGDDDQIVPIDASARRSVELVKDATLKVYPGAPHGLAQVAPTKDQFNTDLLDFLNA